MGLFLYLFQISTFNLTIIAIAAVCGTLVVAKQGCSDFGNLWHIRVGFGG